MRGTDTRATDLFSYIDIEARVPKGHPLRPTRELVDTALRQMSARFDAVYSNVGRPSIAPERLVRALLLQVLYSVRSERLLMEQLEYNLLFRWFVGLSADEPVWEHSVFSKNRERFLQAEVAQQFFAQIRDQAKAAGLISDEHFSVDGTLIDAWASHKSFRAKDGSDKDKPDGGGRNAERDFHGECRSNATHVSSTDPQAKLFRKSKGQAAKLCYAGHVLIEHRNALPVAVMLTQANGTAEREAGQAMLDRTERAARATVAGDKNYDTRGFVQAVRQLGVTPHVAQNHARSGGSAIDARTTRHEGYAISQIMRKRIEEGFGWGKDIGPLRKTKFRGQARVGFQFVLTMASYNLVRLRKLLAPPMGMAS